MPTLGELRRRLGLEAGPDAAGRWASVEEASRLVPGLPPQRVGEVAEALLILEAARSPTLLTLLQTLRDAAMSAQPERELVRLTARWSGGFAEIRASWGDVVAWAGKAAGPPLTLRLEHAGRHVGSLAVAVPEEWQALVPVLAEYALLARLRAAAAGAARRRVGERTLDALLAGQPPEAGGPGALGTGPFALALATLPPSGPPEGGAASPDLQALDLLAAVGEGYFSERKLVGHATVRGGRAVWLWTTLDLPREARELHLSLTASTALDVRLGVSGRRPGAGAGAGGRAGLTGQVQGAFGEARQALLATRQARGYTIFHELDALHALLADGSLTALAAQVGAQLAVLDDEGRTLGTLRAYLDHRGSLAELAAAQGVHVNTLRYRLRRAEEALGARLSDPALLARLYLAFRAQAGP